MFVDFELFIEGNRRIQDLAKSKKESIRNLNEEIKFIPSNGQGVLVLKASMNTSVHF